MKVVIALGSNIGDSQKIIAEAVESISRFVDEISLSTLWITQPVGGVEQRDFTNAVLVGNTTLSPEKLLAELQEIELAAGRVRTVRWGPRTLDLDIVAYEGVEQPNPELTLPHPRAHERLFVLGPWSEIEPDAQLSGVPIAELIKELSV